VIESSFVTFGEIVGGLIWAGHKVWKLNFESGLRIYWIKNLD
jgi:hypothetical protein